MARYGFDTQLVHGTRVYDDPANPVNPPVYTASTFAFPTADSSPQWDYARSGNPTRQFVETQIARLETAGLDEDAVADVRSFAFASGLAAIHAILSTFAPGDVIVADKTVYGGTYSQLQDHFTRWGIVVRLVDFDDVDGVERAVAGTGEFAGADGADGAVAKAVYFEALTNPLLALHDVAAVSEIAHRHGAISIVDNTFLTPYLLRPLEFGADVVLHSATKYLGGHSNVIAGLATVRGKDLADRVYFAQNRLGGILSPRDCEVLRTGIQTLALRLDRQSASAEIVARTLADDDRVKTVNYPSLAEAGSPTAEAARTLGVTAFGGVLSFEVADGIDPLAVLDGLHLFTRAVSLGAVESLAEYPARMTHFEIPKPQRLEFGITDELLRLSVGIENVDDLLADLRQALDAAAK
ncbi:trans-sulfuration enzyme family protein [Bifidobacterium aerophilum]|uniref:Homocysteine desulfhydrase n=1 Tax=Bifidobacterium aerophilum TaxID=1798155 RepID=A0A6N9Z3M0_9BIFI|nr:PLP-dependent aspartate aminotransferase family protein [Bifidobacterium aerophilum]NEG89076.1 cystathionine beta-lyase [Bifidobacterium aerophilum]